MLQNFSKKSLALNFSLSNWKKGLKMEKFNTKGSVLGLIFVRLAKKILFGKKGIFFFDNWPHFAIFLAFYCLISINLNDVGK